MTTEIRTDHDIAQLDHHEPFEELDLPTDFDLAMAQARTVGDGDPALADGDLDLGDADLGAAVGEARKAGGGGSIDGFVERMAERVGGTASVRAVFGDPIERDGITVIPVARVRYGFGGGAGNGPASESRMAAGSGTGGGGGVSADPVGYLEIGPDGASFYPISSARPSAGFMLAAGATAALVLRALAKLLRR
ncbi:MAG TPA: spore germination protein GerW family protein [Candidatus Limnocylindria bacterium]|nr:spore germination protein GerW family protein [Candidatus Limnocylindria bacterium]